MIVASVSTVAGRVLLSENGRSPHPLVPTPECAQASSGWGVVARRALAAQARVGIKEHEMRETDKQHVDEADWLRTRFYAISGADAPGASATRATTSRSPEPSSTSSSGSTAGSRESTNPDRTDGRDDGSFACVVLLPQLRRSCRKSPSESTAEPSWFLRANPSRVVI